MVRWIAIAVAVAALGIFLFVQAASRGWFAEREQAGTVAEVARSERVAEAYAADQSLAREILGAPEAKQVLFGDFHVHTTFSFDAFMMNLPMAGGGGSYPPADACDFARHCSALDFWSINDHAETLTPDMWAQTVESVRQCNDVAGDPSNPDLVTYLGWEWSHIGTTPRNHYGHKNVVLLGTDDEDIIPRPIAARSATSSAAVGPSVIQRLGLAAMNGRRGMEFNKTITSMLDVPSCPDNVPLHKLPLDCRESAATPETLFAKLNEYGVPSIVIPHGTAWGLYTPAGSDWRKQLRGHDPGLETLVEVYSGHGNSEQLPSWREVGIGRKGSLSCPEPTPDYLPSCWRAGQLVEAACLENDNDADECSDRAASARRNYLNAYQAGWKTLPGHEPDAWLDAGQYRSGFQPAFNYRPRSSVQYMLAIRDFENPAEPKGFNFGFIGSSDIHSARPGTGYKEMHRGEFSDGRGARDPDAEVSAPMFGSSNDADEPVDQSVPYDSTGESPLQLFEIERASAYFATGGLVAVHSTGRDRQSIWDALERKEVYATSGRRTLLWFDMINGEKSIPMGSTTIRSTMPRFRVRASGSFEQKPGCPDDTVAALGQERVDHICQGECYFPSDERRPITRIEVVRIRPQIHEDEDVNRLVEDPWRVFPCPNDGGGCVVEFADPEFASKGRDTVYYARAIEADAPLIHGSNPLGCTFDDEGNCVAVSPCGADAPLDDDCLSPGEPRAWSSPIYVNFDL
ncbi:MAG: DUF3604 domain-containing protein [Myxococcota bacterium]|nr:DUF3604 domain-containing protein [Myxococcota bacterium]